MTPKAPKSYLVFARKFRPQIFDEIVGQESIVETLKNAIKENRVSQSFLFTGTRGVGKTSTARILAKSLNCEKGATVRPCGKCTSCVEITNGSSLDVIEIDGASNNSVDNVRDLRESIALSPVNGRYKIYIIDEVHMLSAGAFNALLKTLEEPPAHAKFIFATTDAHKVPATIISRCQRFHFRRIPFTDITSKLEEIAKLEKIEIEKEALSLIAKAGEGSLRDAEGFLDQFSNFSRGKIETKQVEKALGLASTTVYLSLIKAWGKKNTGEALQILERGLEDGFEIVPFVKGLYEMVRNFLVLRVHPDPKGLIDLAPEIIEEIKQESKAFTTEGLLAILSGIEKLLQIVPYSPAARFALETMTIRFASVSDTVNLSELLERLEGLEKKSSLRIASEATAAPIEEKAPVETSPSPKTNTFFTLNQVEAVWDQVIHEVEAQKMSLGPTLREAEPISTENGAVILGFPVELKFHRESLEQPDVKALVEKAFGKHLGSSVTVKTVLTTPEVSSHNAPESKNEAQSKEIPPIVESALSNIFKGGRVIRRD